ncbi:hypothetical protein E1B28_000882 [Marasmius oreades]|uniref:RRM domain-containing protein n=1 Tax=Marasmius oreades TaxID=181124 RepID=A0A9P8AEL7_9AGAR|nr:uncharacterized protein E1B28_000882 [Marasmius oreades]KAG7098996.1 hypothetical protein E1B28_000882 [Marasmius oreades]
MTSDSKLTKKQKKAIAFRERKSEKARKNVDTDGMEGNELPTMEVQDSIDNQGDKMEGGEVGKPKGIAKDKSRTTEEALSSEEKDMAARTTRNKKGKDKETVDVEKGELSKKTKKRKRDGEQHAETKTEGHSTSPKRRKTEGGRARLILFLGNLKYTTSQDSILAHFQACDPPPKVRLLTPKVISPKSTTTKTKGCAFLEFETPASLQQALKLHHSRLDGRTINVELTAGGGGNSEARLNKLRERNQKLHGERKTGKASEGSITSSVSESQRYSATSGVGDAPVKKISWAVGDTVADGPTHRGGKKHKKQRVREPAKWGTGVNAIPVG